jgi:hypothetical protein
LIFDGKAAFGKSGVGGGSIDGSRTGIPSNMIDCCFLAPVQSFDKISGRAKIVHFIPPERLRDIEPRLVTSRHR